MKQRLLLKLLAFTAMIGFMVPGFAQGTAKTCMLLIPRCPVISKWQILWKHLELFWCSLLQVTLLNI
ncbi:MAG: hypothetical protein HC905_11265 [Bacteroidales bacterium]|nr:hypothetical protein [Bacteroidales bacterium]